MYIINHNYDNINNDELTRAILQYYSKDETINNCRTYNKKQSNDSARSDNNKFVNDDDVNILAVIQYHPYDYEYVTNFKEFIKKYIY